MLQVIDSSSGCYMPRWFTIHDSATIFQVWPDLGCWAEFLYGYKKDSDAIPDQFFETRPRTGHLNAAVRLGQTTSLENVPNFKRLHPDVEMGLMYSVWILHPWGPTWKSS